MMLRAKLPDRWRCRHDHCQQQAYYRTDQSPRSEWCYTHRPPDATTLEAELVGAYPLPGHACTGCASHILSATDPNPTRPKRSKKEVTR